MKKRIFVTLMATLTISCLCLAACGSGSSSNDVPATTRIAYDESTATTSDEPETTQFTEDGTTFVLDAKTGETLAIFPEGFVDPNDTTAESPEESTTAQIGPPPGGPGMLSTQEYSYNSDPNETIAAEPENEYSPTFDESLIICEIDRDDEGQAAKVWEVDIESGTRNLISRFSTPVRMDGNAYGVPDNMILSLAIGSQQRYRFSPDYQKVAADIIFGDTQERHAGWFYLKGNNKGNQYFYDMSKELGLAADDPFAEAVHHYSIGFTPDGEYYMFENGNKICYVRLSDNTIVEGEENPFLNRYQLSKVSKHDYAYLTSQIDETHFVADACDRSIMMDSIPNSSCIVEFSGSEVVSVEEFLPENSKKIFWSGTINPARDKIALYTANKQGDKTPTIYIVTRDGSESPVEVPMVGSNTMVIEPIILEWRVNH